MGARGGLIRPYNFWTELDPFTLRATVDSLPFVNLPWPWREEIPAGKVLGEGAETGAIVRPVPGNCFGAEWVSDDDAGLRFLPELSRAISSSSSLLLFSDFFSEPSVTSFLFTA